MQFKIIIDYILITILSSINLLNNSNWYLALFKKGCMFNY